MLAPMRSDKRKNPELVECHYLNFQECKGLTGRVHVMDDKGKIAEVSITSKKTWKTRPEIEIHWKFGLYEYGEETVYPDKQQAFFIALD